jgi:hypothetical protein
LARLLLVAATTGYQTRAFADAARRQGLDLTLATDRCHVLEDPWGDRAVAVKFEAPEQTPDLEADGIVAVGDRSTGVAAEVARRLGITWHPVEAVALCRNKSLMREAFRAAGLPCPAKVSGEFPCVLKPVGMSGSRGVIRANNEAEFEAARARIGRIAPDQAIQVEEYIPGREFAVEGIMSQGVLRVLALFDKPEPLEGPYFEETIYVTPSREPASVQAAIVETCRTAVKALGLFHGPIHAEMRVNERGVYMLEIAARPIGGLCAKVLRFEGGLTLEDLVVLHAVGRMPEELKPARAASGVMMIPTPGAGVLEAVSGGEGARRTPLITDVAITAKQGERLTPLPEGASYPGFIFAEGDEPGAVVHALKEAHSLLTFRLLATLPEFGAGMVR